MLRDTLPAYVANCFLQAGFDTLDVIADMDVSSNPGNSIDLIAEFIAKEFPGDPDYTHNPKLSCRFLPGHRLRIVKFVEEVKRMMNSKVAGRKRPSRTVELPRSKRSASTSSTDTCDEATMEIISQLLRSKTDVMEIKVMNLSKITEFPTLKRRRSAAKVLKKIYIVTIACWIMAL